MNSYYYANKGDLSALLGDKHITSYRGQKYKAIEGW